MLLEKYDTIIKEQLNKGIIEQVTDDSEVGPFEALYPPPPSNYSFEINYKGTYSL